MGKKGGKTEDRGVKSSDFSNYQSIDARPTGLNQIFASFSNIYLSQTGTNNVESSGKVKGPEDSYLTVVESQSEVLTLLNKLNKKDAVTKSKALETLNSLIDTLSDVVVEELIVDIIHVIRRLIIVEPVRKIRSELGVLLFKIALKLKKKTQRYLESFITYWWIAMHDDSNDVAEIYVSAFKNLFTTTCSNEEFEQKTFRILMFYIDRLSCDYTTFVEKNITSYTTDWIDIFGKSCQNSATIADMHNRFLYALMHSLMKFFIYFRLYGSQSDSYGNFCLEKLVNKRFIEYCRDICKSGSFKQRLSCLKMLVELVKMLDQTQFDYVKDILKIALECIKMDNETHIVYHNVRLICACTRYNNACIEPSILYSYDTLLISILDRCKGNVGNKIEFYFLFPSLVTYLPKEWVTGTGRKCLLHVLEHIVNLIKEEISDAKKNFYTFDAKLFSQLGSCMLCCYYKILLQLESMDITLVEYIYLPFQILFLCQDLCKTFISQLPKIFSEFIEESCLMTKHPNLYDAVVNKLVELSTDIKNVAFMITIFNSLENTHKRFNTESNFRKVQMGLIDSLVYEEFPRLLEEYLKGGILSEEITSVLNALGVFSLQELRTESKLFDVPTRLFSGINDEAFEAKFQVIRDVFSIIFGSIDVERLVRVYDVGSTNFLFASLVAMNISPGKSVYILKDIFSKIFDTNDPFVSFLLVKIIQNVTSSVYSEMIDWSTKLSHIDEDIVSSVVANVDPTLLDDRRRAVLAVFSVISSLYSGEVSDIYPIGYITEDVITLYLYAFYKEKIFPFKHFVSFVINNLLDAWVLENKSIVNEEICEKCYASCETFLEKEEDMTAEFGSTLANLQGPVRFTSTMLNVVGYLSKGMSLDVLHRKIFNIFISVWLNHVHEVTESDLKIFYKPFIRSIISLGVDYSTDGYRALSTLFSIHKLNVKSAQENFIIELVNEFMSIVEYDNLKVLHENVQIFEYYYGSMEYKEGVFCIIRSFYETNPFAANFSSVIYRINTFSCPEIMEDIHKITAILASKPSITSTTNHIVHLGILIDNLSRDNVNADEFSFEDVYRDIVRSILKYVASLDNCEFVWLYHAISVFFSNTLELTILYKDYLSEIYNIFVVKTIVYLYKVPTELSIVVFYNILALCFKHGIFQFDDSERTEYEFTLEALNEYLDVVNGLSLENCTMYLNGETEFNCCEAHYIFVVAVKLLKNAPKSCTEEVKECIYSFLEFLNTGHIPACYLFVLISELWSCKILYPQLSEFSSIFTKFLRTKEHIISLPKAALPPFFLLGDYKRLDLSQLIYNLCQYSIDDVQVVQGVDELEEEAENENNSTECDPQLYINGTRLLVLYLNILVGPYIADNILNTHKLIQNTQSCDMENCLISWLTLLKTVARYKELNNLNYANGIIKLLTMKPQDLGKYVEESLQSGIDLAVLESTNLSQDCKYWWLRNFSDLSCPFQESLLHMFLNLLILCLQQLLIKDKQCYEIVKMLYFKTAKMFPGEVGEMWNNCKNSYVKKQIKKFTKSEITQKIIEDEIQIIKMNGLDNLQIMYDAGNRIINAKLSTKAEVPTKISIKIPSTFPLVPLSFTTEEDNSTFKQKYLKWIMLAQSEANRSGISQGLYLWCNNIAKFFDGISECPICYSIVHAQFNTIPSKICKVCKYKFHTECIYKWFRTAQKAKCPLCQSQVSFASYSM
ncbi:conserved hypothetical protein [Theileria equi strain WA]|uniref:E3 ubiquitin-protein ligase listerin n=1 Tax=Theileria equi strain WA TaxID=1537102 RepID=L1LDU7_THEEQ|nr:conserved hypothetical protein [Theileria equi strain WA]EKX73454.1 conserved hypothetical protein [Theileria equi strain WA]|eukprot:XP_004832906.1 conserved hypothetical protein [Theileria equi strain WA]